MRHRRFKCETVDQMLQQGWDVQSKCTTCGLLMRVNLRLVVRIKGPCFSLWNRKTRCRRIGCLGFTEFQAKAPGMYWHERLDAPWPEGGGGY